LYYAAVVIAAAGSIALIAVSSNQAMSRQPEIQGRVFITFILGAAFCEMLGLLGFVLGLVG
jgi:F-type H+-transporting ATPase subunit c